MTDPEIPDVNETDLTREEMETAAEELGVETDGLDDQQLLEQLGVALGELDEDDVEPPPTPSGEDGSADTADEDEADEEAGEGEEAGDEDDEDEDSEGGNDEQRAVGEPIEGPTRDDLRDELRERDLPVSGTKDELAERLAEATEDDD